MGDTVPQSRPVRALWIEIKMSILSCQSSKSRPVRALWIEIRPDGIINSGGYVEAREGLVD